MTGYTYGGSTGATYGGPAGGTYGPRITDWLIGGRPVAVEGDLVADPQTITLPVVVRRAALPYWRQFDRAGDHEVTDGFAGAFRAIDRSGGDPITVEPAPEQQPPFSEFEGYVDDYSEEQLSPDRVRVELTFQRLGNRDQEFDVLQEADGAWELAFESGTIALAERQVGRIESREGTPAGSELTLPVRLSGAQAAVVLDSVGYPGGVIERSVPDGADVFVDETGGRQTVTVGVPEGAVLEAGDWLVRDWSLEQVGYQADRWLVELTIAERG